MGMRVGRDQGQWDFQGKELLEADQASFWRYLKERDRAAAPRHGGTHL